MVFADLGMSLDGFVAGANAGPDNALGDGGQRIHGWMYRLEAWRKRLDRSGRQGRQPGRGRRPREVRPLGPLRNGPTDVRRGRPPGMRSLGAPGHHVHRRRRGRGTAEPRRRTAPGAEGTTGWWHRLQRDCSAPGLKRTAGRNATVPVAASASPARGGAPVRLALIRLKAGTSAALPSGRLRVRPGRPRRGVLSRVSKGRRP
jgi:hypothetical protein